MERRQKLSDTLDNYSSPEYSLYDWQKNDCTHVKNWCKCQLLAGKGVTLYVMPFSLKMREPGSASAAPL
ncbi:hypothetical protein BDA96_09G141800 [Sorghum bicolor]|uniref:Uncharacterized protein n=1 Tax=Sorghum bicolor TaxID=4558 RepID=A0A921U4Q9_SORBI|nr:hypothetical protein BDA96_09G141800 [Sorghum bicolor]